MNQKLLIIVLVALVVIFVITIGIGGCQSGEQSPKGSFPPSPSPKDSGATRALKGLQGKRFLKIGDKATATCASPGQVTFTVTFSFSNPCMIKIQKRAFFRTATRVIFRRCTDSSCEKFTTFSFFQVRVDPKNGPTQNEQIAGKSCFATAVGREGGTITLNGNAIITLVKQPCPEE